ncbi:hypothetical protein FACS1894137_06490 [Spirochaetia bacterium]|nr:hypothetical protein FACS1894137_06490 [Spirochaetia bacterium]
MNQFVEAALNAVKICQEHTEVSPSEAWQQAIDAISNSVNVRKKSCPRNTFLGLCSHGFIVGIDKKDYNDVNNMEREYTRLAVERLRENPDLSNLPRRLWEEIGNAGKEEDSQMDIVVALWKAELIKR